jgi:hypothetical protein
MTSYETRARRANLRAAAVLIPLSVGTMVAGYLLLFSGLWIPGLVIFVGGLLLVVLSILLIRSSRRGARHDA